MKYLFSGAWVEVPVYATYEGCRRIAIDYTVPAGRIAVRDQRVIEPAWRKLISFLVAEGAAITIRKVRSKRAALKLASDYHVVFAIGSDLDAGGEDAKTSCPAYLCLGTRHPACADVMLFAKNLVVPIERVPSRQVLAVAVSEALASRTTAVDAIGGYNFYSDEPVPADALELLHAVVASVSSSPQELPEADYGPFQAMQPPQRRHSLETRTYQYSGPVQKGSNHGAAVIAGGDYVRTDVIPALTRGGFALRVVADLEPHIAEYTSRQFGFESAETDWRRAVDRPGVDTVVIATFHDSHATIAAEALRRGKNVLLEKPPVVTREDLELLLQTARAGGFLDIGYNRRYAPFARAAKQILSQAEGPMTITMLVREVEIPPHHWYRWPKQGTRVTGNLCHWIDLATFWIGLDAVPEEMSVSAPADLEPDEERTLSIVYDDRTTVTIVATQRGDPTLGVQEFIDIRRDDLSIKIDDFRRFHATKSGRRIRRSYSKRDKGHRAMYDEMLRRVKNNRPPLYTIRDLEITSRLTILATDIVRNGTRGATVSKDDLLTSNRQVPST